MEHLVKAITRVELTVRAGWGFYRPGEVEKVTGSVIGQYYSPQGFSWVTVRLDQPTKVGYLEHPPVDVVHVSPFSPDLKVLE